MKKRSVLGLLAFGALASSVVACSIVSGSGSKDFDGTGDDDNGDDASAYQGGATATTAAGKLVSDPTQAALDAANQEHTPTTEEVAEAAAFWSFLIVGRQQGSLSPLVFQSGLSSRITALASEYPTYFTSTNGTVTPRSIVLGESFFCGQGCDVELSSLDLGSSASQVVYDTSALAIATSIVDRVVASEPDGGAGAGDAGVISSFSSLVPSEDALTLLASVVSAAAPGVTITASSSSSAVAGVIGAILVVGDVGSMWSANNALVSQCETFQATQCCGSEPTFAGALSCGGSSCVDSRTDSQNCGACGTVCGAGEQCVQGKCACPSASLDNAPETLCNGACIDTQTDLANCGACGKTCEGECSAGGCNVILAAASTDGVVGPLAIDATYVYWASFADNTINKVPIAGGANVVLASSVGAVPFALTVDGANVYGTFTMGIGVTKTPIGGGTPVTLASGMMPRSPVVDASYVYWTNEDDSVSKVPLDGGPTAAVEAAQGSGTSPSGLAIDKTNLYWGSSSGVTRVPLDGTAPVLLSAGSPYAIAVDALAVYWTDEGMGTVTSVPLGGGPTTTLASGLIDPTAIAVDASNVYWIAASAETGGAGPFVMSVPVGGGTPAVLARSQTGASAIAVDAAKVYWTSASGVIKRAK